MVRVRDLKDQIGEPGPRPILYCAVCGAECSANRGDYFWAREDHVFECYGEPMELVIRRVVYEPVEMEATK